MSDEVSLKSAQVFYCDPSTGNHFTYGQLFADAAQQTSLTACLESNDFYQLFVDLLAAICHHKSVVLFPNSMSVTARNDVERELPMNGRNESQLAETHAQARDWLSPFSTSQSILERLQQSNARVGILTSGSTGRPKVVWHSIPTLIRSVRYSPHHRDAIWGMAYHPAHFAGLQVFFQALCNRNPLIRLFGLPPAEIHTAIDQHPITHLSATPTFFNLLCTPDAPVHASIQRVTSGGERLPVQLSRNIARIFPNAKLTNIYASTEAGAVLVSDGQYFIVPTELHGLVKVIDGELAVHKSLLAESLQAGDFSREFIDGFYLTGDQVDVVSDAESLPSSDQLDVGQLPTQQVAPVRFRFIARRNDMINVGGYKVNPLEIEELLVAMDEVAEARVYGQANSVTGNLVSCDLVLVPGCTLSTKQIRERLDANVSPYKIPRIVNIVNTLPKTHSGKQLRSL